PGVPIHVQRRELADARTEDDYTVRAWVDFPGATYVEHDGEAEVARGVRLLPAPGHTAGHQVVVGATDDGPGGARGDVGYSFADRGRGDTPGRRLVLELGAPTYLAHVERPRVPQRRPGWALLELGGKAHRQGVHHLGLERGDVLHERPEVAGRHEQ